MVSESEYYVTTKRQNYIQTALCVHYAINADHW